MKRYLLLLMSTLLIMACTREKSSQKEDYKGLNTNTPNSKMNDAELVAHVREAINPKFTNWVLFSHGTYLILEDTVKNKQQVAVELMKEYGPVYPGSPAGDFSVISLNQTKGWSVTGHCYGMYTYVNPSEMETQKPTDIEVGMFGRSKREKDGKDLKIIYIN